MNESENIKELDRRIASRLQTELPEAPANEWFTPRVMNRLPEKRRSPAAILTQWICYLLSLATLATGGWFTINSILHNGLTIHTMVLLCFIPVLAIFCTVLLAAPAVRKVIDGEDSLLR